MREVPQLIMVPPTENLRHGVGSRDEEQLSAGALSLQIAERVDRVGDALAVHVDAADRELRVVCGGDDGHEVPVLARRHPLLVPRHPRRHEDDLVEIEALGDLAGGDDVTMMDESGRANACTPVNTAHTVCRLLLE